MMMTIKAQHTHTQIRIWIEGGKSKINVYVLYALLSSTDWLPPAAMTKMKMINIHSNNESVCPH